MVYTQLMRQFVDAHNRNNVLSFVSAFVEKFNDVSPIKTKSLYGAAMDEIAEHVIAEIAEHKNFGKFGTTYLLKFILHLGYAQALQDYSVGEYKKLFAALNVNEPKKNVMSFQYYHHKKLTNKKFAL